jgi:hypothetical protein
LRNSGESFAEPRSDAALASISVDFVSMADAGKRVRSDAPTILGLIGATPADGLPDEIPSAMLPMEQPGGGRLAELWTSSAPAERIARGSIHASMAGGLLFGIATAPPGGELTAAALTLYREVITFARDAGTPHLVRRDRRRRRR